MKNNKSSQVEITEWTIPRESPSISPYLPPRRLLKLQQVADIIQCSTRKVYYILAEKKLPVLRIGGLTRIRPEDLNAFLLEHQEHHHVSQSNQPSNHSK